MNIINKLFGTHSERELKLIAPTIDKIEACLLYTSRCV